MAQSAGMVGGSSYSSSLSGQSLSGPAKNPWSVHHVEDRWVFLKDGFALGEHGLLFTAEGKNVKGETVGFEVKTRDADGPQTGDTVHVCWELMKPAKGEHLVPYFRVPEIGPYKYWSVANKAALKYFWKSAKDGRWRVRYQQSTLATRFLNNQSESCLALYAHGIATYAFFTRSMWPEKPDFVPDFGRVELVEVKKDMSQQQMIASAVTGSLTILPNHGGIDLDVAAVQMRKNGFEHVDGDWQALDFDWLCDPEYKVDKSGGMRGRKLCDYCLLCKENLNHSACTQVATTDGKDNRCLPCVLRGLPCSWTMLPKLFGNPAFQEEAFAHRSDPVYKKSVALLVLKAQNTAACTAHVSQDPGFTQV